MQTLDTRDRYSSCESSSTPPSAILHEPCFVQATQTPADILDWSHFRIFFVRASLLAYVIASSLSTRWSSGCCRTMALKPLSFHMCGFYCVLEADCKNLYFITKVNYQISEVHHLNTWWNKDTGCVFLDRVSWIVCNLCKCSPADFLARDMILCNILCSVVQKHAHL